MNARELSLDRSAEAAAALALTCDRGPALADRCGERDKRGGRRVRRPLRAPG